MTIGFLGRLTEQRGVSYLIEAFRYFSNADTRLIIIGGGEQRSDLMRQASGLNVFFVGEIADPSKWIEQFDFAVFPSTKVFGLPLAALEVMAKGVPVILTYENSEMHPESIMPFHTGVIVAPKCVPCLMNAMRLLVVSPWLRKRMGSEARAFVQKHHSVARFTEQMQSIYGSILA